MTEREWQVCGNPEQMLAFLLGSDASGWPRIVAWFTGKAGGTGVPQSCATERKMRLFACACLYPLRELLKDPRSEAAIEVSERFAERQATSNELTEAGNDAWLAVESLQPTAIELASPGFALGSTMANVWPLAARAAADVTNLFASEAAVAVQGSVERASMEWAGKGPSIAEVAAVTGAAARAHLLRDIIGPLPFREVRLDPGTRTETVRNLAYTIYKERDATTGRLDTSRLAVLAHALEEAGCTNIDVLQHCREDGVHVRGCWVVDLLLGKE
jgi:hypothetical protein